MNKPFTCHTHRTSVCVGGGGMAGLIAVMADCAPEDVAPPDHGLEKPGKSVVGA